MSRALAISLIVNGFLAGAVAGYAASMFLGCDCLDCGFRTMETLP